MKNVLIFALVVMLGATSYTAFVPGDQTPAAVVEVDTGLVNSTYTEYYPLVVTAFNRAEKEFIKKVVIDEVQRMDPDPKICACKGTGLMPTDGGAVKLYCKYHGNRSSDDRIAAIEERMAQMQLELDKEVVIDAPILREGLEELMKEREKAVGCTCTPEQAAAGTCPCGENCKCHEKTPTKEPVVAEAISDAEPLKEFVRKEREKNTADNTVYQVIMFSAEWCEPCKQFKSTTLKEYYKKVEGLEFSKSASADFRVLDIDDPLVTDFYVGLREGYKSIPVFVEIKDNVVVSRRFGIKDMDVQFLIDTYDFEEKR